MNKLKRILKLTYFGLWAVGVTVFACVVMLIMMVVRGIAWCFGYEIDRPITRCG